MARVALLREPLGLPELPLENWPAVFLPFFIKKRATLVLVGVLFG